MAWPKRKVARKRKAPVATKAAGAGALEEAKARRPRMKPSEYPAKNCLLCGKEFRSKPCMEQVYCSRPCGAKAAGENRLAKRIEKYCQVCSAPIKIKPSHKDIEGTYCSTACMVEGYKTRLKGSANPNWKGGISSSPEYNRINLDKAKVRRILRLRDDPVIPSEHEEQSWLVAECRKRGGSYAKIFAIPNSGGNLTGPAQSRLKREGRTPGIPDLFLPTAASGFHGAFLEMKKTKGGKISVEQVEWIGILREAGYCALVCLGYVAAIKAIEDYLDNRITGFGKKLHEYSIRS